MVSNRILTTRQTNQDNDPLSPVKFLVKSEKNLVKSENIKKKKKKTSELVINMNLANAPFGW